MRVFAGDIYGDHALSCAGIIGIKHRHNVVRDTLGDISNRSGISVGKEIDIGLDGGVTNPYDQQIYCFTHEDRVLDVCVDLTGSLPLTQTEMAGFMPGRAVIDAAQRSYRSKEDEVLKISTSVFVANFPDSFGAKDLWNTCKQYGHVVDAYILYKRSKAGKRFGFIRFIKVLDVDRLVNNLCTVWVGRHKLQANNPRFEREPLKRHISLHNIDGVKRGNSEDTYKSNGVKGKVFWVRAKEVPGWILDFMEDNDEEEDSKVGSYEEVPNGEDVKNVEDLEGDSNGEIVPDIKFEENFPNQKGEEDSVGQGSKEVTGEKQFDLKKKSKNDVEESICLGHFKKSEVPKLGGSILQLIDDLVKVGETIGASIGNSGEIMCVWDPNMFKKTNSTVSYYFVMVRGDWMPNGKKLLIISVYTPEELSEKKMLWDYLSLVMSKWEGDVVIMDSLLCSCPNISSITLDRYLSDHRPILMYEVYYDYGPVPLRFFHYWFEVDSFDKVIEDSWKDAPIIESNALVRMMKKVKYLKEKIQVKKNNSLEAAQKAKIKWAIEGDENSKYYHDAMTCFFHQGSFPKGGNSSFIILIPKTPNANMVNDYRTISLIGSMYKIIFKILANRLVVVLGGIVNEIQSDFVADKQIINGPFILNELVQWCKKKKKQSLVFKVDFEKAYDSVRWDHLKDIMRKLGFGEKWCMWIQSCLWSSRGSVIVNGSPTEKFQFYKGLKQVDVDLFKGIELAPSLNLSNMFYADDAIFMGQWCESNIDTIVKVLDCFNHVSSLRINMTKSKMLGISVEDDKGWQFKHMKEKVEGCILVDMMERWFWALEGSSEFTIMSVRKMIDDFMLPKVSSKTRWIKAVPIKGCDFVPPPDSGDGVVEFVLYGFTNPRVSCSQQLVHVDDLLHDQHDGFTLALLDSLFSKGLRTVKFIPPKCRLGFSRVLKGALDKVICKPDDISCWCKRKICDGHYTAKVSALSSFGVAPYNEATLEDLKSKHPFKPALSLPHIAIDHHHLIASPSMVLDRIKSFPRGTSRGRDGLRAQHLIDCLSGDAVAISDDLVSFITQVVNLFLD
nr:RNA-directed DNA polymerase, eukaryota [Tanacetum cinerariifolium]